MQNWGIQGNSAKSTNNPMSSFGLIEEDMELSHTDYAVFKFTHSILWITPPTMFSTRTVKALVLQDSKHPFIDRRNGNK